jgi:hypothetical protein
VYLNVPFYAQMAGLKNGPAKDDPYGCWYASAKMIGAYWDGNPIRIGVPELTHPDGTHEPLGNLPDGRDGYGRLAFNEKLMPISPQLDTASDVDGVLSQFGPILIYWWKQLDDDSWFAHASVIVGTFPSNRAFVYHDPALSPNQQMIVNEYKVKRSIKGSRLGMFVRIPSTIPKPPKRSYDRGWERILKS